jgi:phospholipase/lecithinase/hemolysin
MRFAEWCSRGAAALVLALLASCGGGTQVERFVPTRLVVLGDETSLINPDGSKYTVNAVVSATDTTLDCQTNLLWVQVLARAYGLVFAQCNPTAAAVTAQMYSAAGAKVADIAAQVTQVGGFTDTTLVTLLAGANDVLAQYARYPGVGETQLSAELEATGAALAAQVNSIADAGGKVLISTVPDLGLSPFGQAEKAGNTDTDRAALLSRLTGRLNAKLRANIVNDGRRIGLLLEDEVVQTDVKFPSTYGFVNVTEAACLATALPPACTTLTLQPATATVAAAGSFSWLWAGAALLSPGAHNQLGALAVARTNGNPF